MALTISVHPDEVITNAPEFTVTTSLSEDASHQNLRVRATVYIGGRSEAVSVLHLPKGLSDWNFFAMLKSLTGRCDIEINGSALHLGPDMGSELMTAWAGFLGWETFTSSGRTVTVADNSGGGAAQARTNDLGSSIAGDIYVVGMEDDYDDTSSSPMSLRLSDAGASQNDCETNYAGKSGGKLIDNHIYFLMAHEVESSPMVYLESVSSPSAFEGTMSVHKISDYRNNPGVYFHVKFEEVYENASDVITIGAESWSDCMLFIPAKMKGSESFDSYIMDAGSKYFLTRMNGSSTSERVLDEKSPVFKFRTGMEVRLMYAHVGVYLKAQCTVDAGTNEETDIPNAGWGMLVMNSSGGFTYDPDENDETLVFILTSITGAGATIYASGLTVYCDSLCYPSVKVGSTNYPLMRALSFIGDLGEEVVLFRGLETENGESDKEFYKDSNRVRKVLKTYSISRLALRTKYETEAYRRLLHELVNADKPVYMYGFYIQFYDAKLQEVTVITDGVPIEDQKRLIDNEIEVEYNE